MSKLPDDDVLIGSDILMGGPVEKPFDADDYRGPSPIYQMGWPCPVIEAREYRCVKRIADIHRSTCDFHHRQRCAIPGCPALTTGAHVQCAAHWLTCIACCDDKKTAPAFYNVCQDCSYALPQCPGMPLGEACRRPLIPLLRRVPHPGVLQHADPAIAASLFTLCAPCLELAEKKILPCSGRPDEPGHIRVAHCAFGCGAAYCPSCFSGCPACHLLTCTSLCRAAVGIVAEYL